MNTKGSEVEFSTEPAMDVHTILAAGWIPVEEKMPLANTPVLVYGICHKISIAEYEFEAWWESCRGDELKFEPGYWMPLPFPE